MLDMVDFNHVQHISFTQSRLTDAVSVILNGLLSYEHPPKHRGVFFFSDRVESPIGPALLPYPFPSGAGVFFGWPTRWTKPMSCPESITVTREQPKRSMSI